MCGSIQGQINPSYPIADNMGPFIASYEYRMVDIYLMITPRASGVIKSYIYKLASE